jgi:flagellar biosynthesis GTPase FlhF
VRDGYAGVEGDVDADVVVNLSTLLLTHSPSQRLNQSKLETYFSATAHPTFDISSHLSSPSYARRKSATNGTDTPRDLNTRIKLLELYTLHVLPRNDEWDYAREFISMSEVLDDERKEAFLLALHSLKEEKEDAEKREEKLRQQQMEQMEERRRESEQKRVEMARMEEETRKQDEARKQTDRVSDRNTRGMGDGREEGRDERGLRQPKPTSRRTPAKKPSTPPPGLYNRVGGLFAAIQKAIADSAKQMTSNPLAFLRTLLFLIAFSIAFGKRDLRERIMRLVRQAVDKVRRTVGMGVKVSYI